jgi:large subunit ribosomal protein L18
MGSVDIRRYGRLKRKARIRKRVSGNAQRPRFSVFRSAKHIYAQIIDDTAGKTLASASSTEKAVKELPKFENKIAMAEHIGKIAAERALRLGIKRAVFDRNGFLYHGRIKAVSDGARKAGLDF